MLDVDIKIKKKSYILISIQLTSHKAISLYGRKRYHIRVFDTLHKLKETHKLHGTFKKKHAVYFIIHENMTGRKIKYTMVFIEVPTNKKVFVCDRNHRKLFGV